MDVAWSREKGSRGLADAGGAREQELGKYQPQLQHILSHQNVNYSLKLPLVTNSVELVICSIGG